MDPRRTPVRTTTARLLLAALTALSAIAVLASGSSPAVAATPAGDRCFVRASFRVFLDREASSAEISTWAGRLGAGGGRSQLPRSLATSDEWLGVEVSKLYRAALDREPDAPGRGYWIDALRRGALVNRVGTQVYGSDEFYRKAGGTPTAFVNSIYTRILGRAPDAAGRAYWVGQINTLGRGAVAASFFASPESRNGRIRALYQQVLGRAADAGGLVHWARELLRSNDVQLAIQLASSNEFYDRHARCEGSGPIAYGQTVTGAITSPGQQVRYTINGRAGDRLSLHRLEVTGWPPIMRLTAPNGAVIWNDVGFDNNVATLPQSGTYQLTLSHGTHPRTGTFRFHLSNQRDPQTFDLGWGTTVSNGAPRAGMGNIERPGSADRYRISGRAGERLSVQRLQVTGYSPVMRLVAPNGAVIWDDVGFGNAVASLPQDGTYQLTFSHGANPRTSTYSFRLARA